MLSVKHKHIGLYCKYYTNLNTFIFLRLPQCIGSADAGWSASSFKLLVPLLVTIPVFPPVVLPGVVAVHLLPDVLSLSFPFLPLSPSFSSSSTYRRWGLCGIWLFGLLTSPTAHPPTRNSWSISFTRSGMKTTWGFVYLIFSEISSSYSKFYLLLYYREKPEKINTNLITYYLTANKITTQATWS